MPRRLALTIPLLVALIAGPVATAAPPPGEEFALEVLSTRSDLVTGGDALIEVMLPGGQAPAGVTVDAGGRDVTDAFAVRADGRFYGRVTGLEVGDNVLTATLPDGSGARITVTNHPIGGPVFAGPQVQPLLCRTEEAGLGPATDAQCNAQTRIDFLYRSTDPGRSAGCRAVPVFPYSTAQACLLPYDPADPPTDIAETTTDQGETVPYVVRRERGVIDRGIYEIMVLADPSQPVEPWTSPRGWNHKLYWPFGNLCSPSHVQRTPPAGQEYNLPPPLEAVSRGFMVALSNLTALGNNCNTVVGAEVVTMVKEHIVETYGEIRYTIGDGCSGGAIMQNEIADNYPGLIDGLLPKCSFPDIWSIAAVDAFDCSVLSNYFSNTSPHLWGVEVQREAVLGYQPGSIICDQMGGFARTFWDPTFGCGLDAAQTYHPQDNPAGTRCTLSDYMVAQLGRRADDGFGNRPLDNVGVQYGLEALRDGVIVPEQFVDLNEHVGGWDIDANFQTERSEADRAALDHMYRAGRITYGSQLDEVPIIDVRSSDNYDVHANLHPRITEARLIRANGHRDNLALWLEPTEGFISLPKSTDLWLQSFDVMDEWLNAIEADTSADPLAVKVVRNRPAGAADGCFENGERVSDQACAAYRSYEDPRLVAGMPMTRDILKCQLTPPSRGNYGVMFSDAQWSRLVAAFPDGVCDWTRPGVAQQAPIGAWLTFAEGPGGAPLGDPPVSVPFGPDGAGPSEPPGAPPPAVPPPAPGVDEVRRVSGGSRLDTAIALSREAFESADAAVLARADDYPDALAASALAAELDAPVLLTPTGGLDDRVGDELERLGVTEAHLMGGTQALSEQIPRDLDARGIAHTRVGGAERFATAALIADQVVALGGPVDQAIVALGARPDGRDAWPDALAAGNLAATGRAPILLTAPDAVPEVTAAALDRLLDDGSTVFIAGGTQAVGEQPEAQLRTGGHDTRRLAGADRYATAAAIVAEAIAQGADPDPTVLASGELFADALVAGPAAHQLGGVLLLVAPDDLDGSPATGDFLTANADAIATVLIAGGPNTVTDRVAQQVRALLTTP